MKYQKICIIGDGLSGLVIATALADLDLNIDIYYQDSKVSYKQDGRTTAISESNFRFLSKKINIKNQNSLHIQHTIITIIVCVHNYFK